MQLAVHDADDGEAHACNLHGFANGIASAEELLLYASTQKCDAAFFDLVAGADPAAFGRHFVAHLAVFGTHAADGGVRQSVFVGDGKKLHRLQAGMLDQCGLGLHRFEVGELEPDFLAGALASGLLAGLLGPGGDGALAEGLERMHQHVPKAAAVGDEQRDGHDAPHDAQHGEQAARAAATQRDPGFPQDFAGDGESAHSYPPAS